MWPGGAFPVPTFTNATIASTSSITISIASRKRCSIADTSMPR